MGRGSTPCSDRALKSRAKASFRRAMSSRFLRRPECSSSNRARSILRNRQPVYTADPSGAATPIMVDSQAPPLTAPAVRVTLDVAVKQLCPPGWPAPPYEQGVAAPGLFYPRVIPAGTTIIAFACVAAALIGAGAATPA